MDPDGKIAAAVDSVEKTATATDPAVAAMKGWAAGRVQLGRDLRCCAGPGRGFNANDGRSATKVGGTAGLLRREQTTAYLSEQEMWRRLRPWWRKERQPRAIREREMCSWAISINVLVIRCPTHNILVHMCQVLKRDANQRIKV
jgi:hypothetical protein